MMLAYILSPQDAPPTQWIEDWIVLAILFIGFPFAGAFAAAGAMKIWEWLGRLEKWSRRKVLKARYLKTD